MQFFEAPWTRDTLFIPETFLTILFFSGNFQPKTREKISAKNSKQLTLRNLSLRQHWNAIHELLGRRNEMEYKLLSEKTYLFHRFRQKLAGQKHWTTKNLGPGQSRLCNSSSTISERLLQMRLQKMSVKVKKPRGQWGVLNVSRKYWFISSLVLTRTDRKFFFGKKNHKKLLSRIVLHRLVQKH